MRPDMDKVIVERPRRNSSAKSPNTARSRQRLPMDEWPTRQSMHRTDKYLNENLNPLMRFLESNVGRPWNHVHSELAAHIDRGNAVQAHVWQHLEQYVTLHVIIVDGRVLSRSAGPFSSLERTVRLYVHPVSGLLCRNREALYRRWRYQPEPPLFRQLAPHRFAGQLDGVWFEIQTAPVRTAPPNALDVVLKAPVSGAATREDRATRQRHYGDGSLYAVAKRAMNSREIKALGLRAATRPLPCIVR